MIRNAQPLVWRPRGVSDTLDSSSAFEGAMTFLTNLIPDPSTSGLFQCRPAAIKLIDATMMGGGFSSGFSSGFQTAGTSSTAGTISVFHIFSNLVYGMIGNTATGFDTPFCFNLSTNTFITVSGVTSSNVPQSQPTSGPWTPPIMDLIGTKLVVTHPGFSATSSMFGWFDLTTPTAPVWNAGNLTGAITFSIPPTFVAQFNGRAYYIVNVVVQPAVVFSDIFNPLNVTNATQVVTFGDTIPLTALGQLRLFNQLGGIIQALIIFKGVSNTYQLTGDSALNNLTLNAMNFATGTRSPLSVCSTPKGLAFLAPDGLRIIDFQANISDPIGVDGKGIVVPFINVAVPSRAVAACNVDVIRVTVQNPLVTQQQQEWWYHISRGIWTGPHTFPAALIQPFQASFLLTGVGIPAKIWQSDTVQSLSGAFVENGLQMTWIYQTTLLPDLDIMSNYSVKQTTFDLAFAATTPPIAINFQDQQGVVIDSIQIVPTGSSAIWGQFNWGSSVWGSSLLALAPRRLPWRNALSFSRGFFEANGQSASAIKLGTLRLMLQKLKFLTDVQAAA